MSFFGVLHDCLLFVNAFAALLTLFGSVLTIAVWCLTALVRWLATEPVTEPKKREQMYVNADQLKRAGQ